ncbi:unnamed protein product [Arctia plantaginis]|uniref:Uncharacterized protein n=1 Tax=Arctia plantaginis TaxID=874455 RepID=A0A8S0ZVX7_ARCPL|nr:unnamed protein product [Arctia plantaginis]
MGHLETQSGSKMTKKPSSMSKKSSKTGKHPSNVVIVVLEDVAVTRTINTRGRNHPVEAAIPIELESRKQRKAVAATGKC